MRAWRTVTVMDTADAILDFIWGPLDGHKSRIGGKVGEVTHQVQKYKNDEGKTLTYIYERHAKERNGEFVGHVMFYQGEEWR